MEPSILLLQTNTMPPQMLIMMFLLMGCVFYFLIIRPQNKKRKDLEKFISVLKNGDKVITHAGIYGVIAGVKDKTFILKISDQVKIEVAKNAIAGPQAEDNP